MSAWLLEASISRSQPTRIPFLTFVLLHSLAVSPLRSSPVSSHKIKQSKEGVQNKRGKFSYAFPGRWDGHQLKTDAVNIRQYSDRLTGESGFLRGRTNALSPPAPARLLPPARSIQTGSLSNVGTPEVSQTRRHCSHSL